MEKDLEGSREERCVCLKGQNHSQEQSQAQAWRKEGAHLSQRIEKDTVREEGSDREANLITPKQACLRVHREHSSFPHAVTVRDVSKARRDSWVPDAHDYSAEAPWTATAF